jgi:hypothetical protein
MMALEEIGQEPSFLSWAKVDSEPITKQAKRSSE